MSSPYVGEIRMVGFNFAPVGWALCDGQLVPISENETLFQLIGTTYGGDGQETFALPNLQSRFPIHMGTLAGGSTYILAETLGVESVQLNLNQIPSHGHPYGMPYYGQVAGTGGNSADPTGRIRARVKEGQGIYKGFKSTADAGVLLTSPSSTAAAGGSQPHDNVPPYLAVDFIISLFGIFPSPN
jgi:microcystin-dependent protein